MSDQNVSSDKDIKSDKIDLKQNLELNERVTVNQYNNNENQTAESRRSIELFMKRKRKGMLGLLIWKNFILQKRRPKGSFFEIFLPVFFGLILLLIRTQVDIEETKQPTVFP